MQEPESECADQKPEPSRARRKKRKKPKPARRDQKPHRVRHCMRLMAQGLWVAGLTADELATKWGVTLRSMESYAAEASRRIREGVMLDDEMRGQVLSTIQSIATEANELGKLARTAAEPTPGVNGAPAKPPRPQAITDAVNAASKALSVKLDAVKAFADISGAKAATKVEVSNNLTELMDQVHREQELQSKTPA